MWCIMVSTLQLIMTRHKLELVFCWHLQQLEIGTLWYNKNVGNGHNLSVYTCSYYIHVYDTVNRHN